MYKSNLLNSYNDVFKDKLGIQTDNLEFFEYMYNINNNAYHNMQHLDNVFHAFENINIEITDEEFHILSIAFLYHDIVYDSKAKDNEEKSVTCMLNSKFTCSKHIIDEAQNLILFSKYQRKPETKLERIFLECDMHIFEESMADQLEYEKQIQKEYAWVPLAVYVPERIKVLEKLNAMYRVDTFPLVNYLENKKWNIGIYAGSFYPFTNGHLDVLKQAEQMFDKVIILQSTNGPKKSNFEWDESKYGKINPIFDKYEVHDISNLITKDLEKFEMLGKVTLIRGLRNGDDLLYEQNYIQTLRGIKKDINVAYFLTKPEFAHVSSSMVRELLKISPYLVTQYLPE